MQLLFSESWVRAPHWKPGNAGNLGIVLPFINIKSAHNDYKTEGGLWIASPNAPLIPLGTSSPLLHHNLNPKGPRGTGSHSSASSYIVPKKASVTLNFSPYLVTGPKKTMALGQATPIQFNVGSNSHNSLLAFIEGKAGLDHSRTKTESHYAFSALSEALMGMQVSLQKSE